MPPATITTVAPIAMIAKNDVFLASVSSRSTFQEFVAP